MICCIAASPQSDSDGEGVGEVNSVRHAVDRGGLSMIYDIGIKSADVLASILVYRNISGRAISVVH